MPIQSIMLRPSLLRSRFVRPAGLLRSRPLSSASPAPPLIRIQNGTFYQSYPTPEDAATDQNPPLFPDFSFELPSQPVTSLDVNGNEAPQQWAIIGASGRTNLLDIFRGQHVCLPPAARSYPYLLTDKIAQKDPRLRFVGNAIQYVGFSGEGSGAIGGTRGAYLSARYESHREETDWTVRQYLKGQTSLNPMEGEEDGTRRDPGLFDQVVADLRLNPLLDMPVSNLSNGQTRRARIAKALLGKPELLLLDDPFMGLDPATVRSISGLLQRLAAKSNPRLVLALRLQDPMPEWITHLVFVGHKNQVLFQGSRSEAQKVFGIWQNAGNPAKPIKTASGTKAIYEKAKRDIAAGYLDKSLLWDMQPPVLGRSTALWKDERRFGEALIEMDGVRVQYGDKVVLGDWKQQVHGAEKDGLHWTVRRGQRWVVLGANGSGKTTLLSLITSDHPQAYAQPVKLFGRSRLPEPGKPAISLFELQSRLGHSSPEIHAFFPRQLTVRQSIESAFAETFLGKPKLSHERDLDVSAVLRYFKAELDPNSSATATAQEPPTVSPDIRDQFPKLDYKKRYGSSWTPDDYEVDYADSLTFGQLNTAQQRLVLFLRAIVHRPDIIILDEAFSGMPASLRDKCTHFLEVGESGRGRSSTMTRRTHITDTWLQGYKAADRSIRYKGITHEQALVMISHTRDDVPDSVRHFMRLPSESDGGEEPLDFRFGMLYQEGNMRDREVWDVAWLPPSEFTEKARRTWRRRSKNEDDELEDDQVYEWWSI